MLSPRVIRRYSARNISVLKQGASTRKDVKAMMKGTTFSRGKTIRKKKTIRRGRFIYEDW